MLTTQVTVVHHIHTCNTIEQSQNHFHCVESTSACKSATGLTNITALKYVVETTLGITLTMLAKYKYIRLANNQPYI